MPPVETVTFTGRAGLRLVGTLHHPADSLTSFGLVVAHGMLSSRSSPKHVAVCESAAAAGCLALRFDFASRGDSDGGAEDLTVSGELEDLAAAVDVIRSRGVTRLALVGSSLGGTVALLQASPLQTSVLVTSAAPAQLPSEPRPEWGEQGAAVPETFFADARRHDALAAASRLACPWRILHGANDDVVPVADAEALASANPGSELLIHPSAGHRFEEREHLEWLIRHVVDFVARS